MLRRGTDYAAPARITNSATPARVTDQTAPTGVTNHVAPAGVMDQTAPAGVTDHARFGSPGVSVCRTLTSTAQLRQHSSIQSSAKGS